MKMYVKSSKMGTPNVTWGTDREIRAAATMFQVVIIVSNEHGRGRIWNFYPPPFEKSDVYEVETFQNISLAFWCKWWTAL